METNPTQKKAVDKVFSSDILMSHLKAKPMNATQYAEWVECLIGGITDRNLICKVLKDNGFRFFFSGYYKKVFRHPSHLGFLTKVYRSDVDSDEDSQYVPRELDNHFLHPIVLTEDYMIQEFADGVGGSPTKALRWFQNQGLVDFDMKQGNVRFHQNRAVVIDFTS